MALIFHVSMMPSCLVQLDSCSSNPSMGCPHHILLQPQGEIFYVDLDGVGDKLAALVAQNIGTNTHGCLFATCSCSAVHWLTCLMAPPISPHAGTFGGVVSQHLHQGVSFAVLRHMQQPAFEAAMAGNIPVVSPEWVVDCGAQEALLPVPEVSLLFDVH